MLKYINIEDKNKMATDNEVNENEQKIVNEFCHHLEKSKQLFNGLRLRPCTFSFPYFTYN